ncbi:DNA-binding response regulator [Hahella sp. CCB-MM4]|uniref:response regulator n=1 Tax=Hahella sp. (strain CCB-MM4) TaxID=1926491 RepID=UPI000B9A67B1|nr:response regulator transcription factor [Hahella sp. CCB-MM4]OZG72526.1 DNA-binding response regulator [Hahella sp. CCB-MM4]
MNLAPQPQALGISEHLRVLIIDDHQLVAEGLRASLRQQNLHLDMEIALNCTAAAEILSKDQNFDLILLDLSLPDSKGLRFLRKLSELRVLIPVAILSGSEDPEDVDLALASGACGYISKSSSGSNIYQDISAILEGKMVLPDFYPRYRRRRPVDLQVDIQAITPRQMEVLQLLAQGLPNKKICTKLQLTEDTVKTHLKSLFMHLNVHNRTECVRVAEKWNLID